MAVQNLERVGRSFRVYWRNPITGKQESKYFDDEREAQRYDSEIRHKIKFDRDFFIGRNNQSGIVHTVESILFEYIKTRKSSDKNKRLMIYHVIKICNEVGNIQADQLTLKQVKGLAHTLSEAGNKDNTINRRMGILKSAYIWAEYEEILTHNPLRNYSYPRGADLKIQPPTPQEIRQILDVAPEQVYRAVVLAFYLGVRVGESELFKIEWSNVDINRLKIMVIAAKKNPNEPFRELDITPSLMDELSKWGEKDGWSGPIVNFKGKPITHMRRAWGTTLKDAGITRRIRPYDLRHAFATYSIENGADPLTVAKIMGHTSTAMIHRNYQHVMDKQRKAAMSAVPDVLGIQTGHTNKSEGALSDIPGDKNT